MVGSAGALGTGPAGCCVGAAGLGAGARDGHGRGRVVRPQRDPAGHGQHRDRGGDAQRGRPAARRPAVDGAADELADPGRRAGVDGRRPGGQGAAQRLLGARRLGVARAGRLGRRGTGAQARGASGVVASAARTAAIPRDAWVLTAPGLIPSVRAMSASDASCQ